MKLASVLFITLALTGCVSLNPYDHELRVPAGPEPNRAQVDATVRAHLAASLKDPDSLKQYELLSVRKTRWMRGALNGGGSEEGWLACFSYNAKNSYGGYVGAKTDGLIFRSEYGEARVVPGATLHINSAKC